MDQQATLRIAAMMNGFKSSGEDIEVRMKLLASRLNGISNAAIMATCDRFADGEVDGQSMRTPPTVPEFVKEAKQQQEYIDIRNRPRPLPKPVYRGGPAPFEVTQEQLRQKYEGRAVLAKGLSHEGWKARQREFPAGHTWVGALNGTVFGPPTTKQKTE